MHRLGHADGREVAIALIGEHDLIGMNAFHARCNRGRTAVGRLEKVAAEKVVEHDRATNRRNADGLAFDSQFVNRLGHQAVDDSVRATRAIIRDDRQQGMRPLVHDLFFSLGHVTHPTLR